jgi:hypothetical protein
MKKYVRLRKYKENSIIRKNRNKRFYGSDSSVLNTYVHHQRIVKMAPFCSCFLVLGGILTIFGSLSGDINTIGSLEGTLTTEW